MAGLTEILSVRDLAARFTLDMTPWANGHLTENQVRASKLSTYSILVGRFVYEPDVLVAPEHANDENFSRVVLDFDMSAWELGCVLRELRGSFQDPRIIGANVRLDPEHLDEQLDCLTGTILSLRSEKEDFRLTYVLPIDAYSSDESVDKLTAMTRFLEPVCLGVESRYQGKNLQIPQHILARLNQTVVNNELVSVDLGVVPETQAILLGVSHYVFCHFEEGEFGNFERLRFTATPQDALNLLTLYRDSQ